MDSSYPKIHKCEKCDKTFSTSTSLRKHIRVDHGGNFKCDSCGQSFVKELGLNVHIAHKHNVDHNHIKNRIRNKNYQQKVQRPKRKSDNMYKCEKCNKEFLTKSYLTTHIENVHEGLKRFKCDTCGKSFSQSGELKRHMAKLHDGEKFKCEFENCGNKYVSRRELKDHIGRTHGYRLKCGKCDRKYLDTHELNIHKLKDHDENEKLKCESCDRHYSKLYIYKYNMKIVYEGEKSRFKCNFCISSNEKSKNLCCECETCNKLFLNERNLKIHIAQAHNSLKIHKCEICDKSFKKIKMHMKVHKGQKSHKCQSCNKSFSKAQNLELHIHTDHESNLSSKCELCGKLFLIESSMKKHIKLAHEGNTPCQCDLCGKSFLKERNLQLHMKKVHNPKDSILRSKYLTTVYEGGRKKYKCKPCNKLYTAYNNVNYHIKVVHQGVKVLENMMIYTNGKYKCKLCDKFDSQNKSSLKLHIIYSHKELQNHSTTTEHIKINPDQKDPKLIEDSEINSDQDSTDDEEWKKYKEKWNRYLKDSTFYEPPLKAKSNEIEPGEVAVESNTTKVIDMKIKINQCHICENDFDNLEDHLITSHRINDIKKEENDFENDQVVTDLENVFKYDPDLLDILESEDLPEGWQEMVDDNGRKFYVDHKTKNTQWEDPRISLMN